MKKGFTLIELLVVIAIIALLSTLAVVALGSAREKARDAKRLSDVKQMQTALELYYTDKSDYPDGTSLVLGGSSAGCLGGGGFAASGCTATEYMGQVPANPTPNGADYVYTKGTATYSITFSLEGTSGGLSSGSHTASPSGMK
ncbi:MAG: type II secretion system protein [Candidatus Magasanikbacteria bacterium]|nr:type II secretion system protein [Candidatus Magasanikbacteria bacterium]